MASAVLIISQEAEAAEQLASLIPSDTYEVTICTPDSLSNATPALFVILLPELDSPEEQVIEKLRADDATAAIPIVIVSRLSMKDLQSVPYASDWTIGIVEEPVEATVLADTMQFLLNPA